jgi:hypothetical protein
MVSQAEVVSPPARRRWKVLFRIALIVTFLVCVNYFVQWLEAQLQVEAGPSNEHIIQRIIITSILIYTLLIAIPFVPSIEIGLGLILVLGADLAPLVYLFTVIGLSLSFVIGCMIPESGLQKFFDDLSLKKSSRLIERLRSLDTDERLALLVSHAPAKFLPTLLRHRYVAVAVALNIPGNTIIGGGGGISLIAGMSRLFRFWQFLLMLSIAVAPVPVIIVLCGTDIFL